MTDENLTCGNCGQDSYYLKRRALPNGKTQVAALCACCHRHYQYVAQTSEPTQIGEIEMPIGKHKGKKLKDVPKDYLLWLSKNTDGSLANKVSIFLNDDTPQGPGAA